MWQVAATHHAAHSIPNFLRVRVRLIVLICCAYGTCAAFKWQATVAPRHSLPQVWCIWVLQVRLCRERRGSTQRHSALLPGKSLNAAHPRPLAMWPEVRQIFGLPSPGRVTCESPVETLCLLPMAQPGADQTTRLGRCGDGACDLVKETPLVKPSNERQHRFQLSPSLS